jgi:protein-arginine kinase activator protein McsA
MSETDLCELCGKNPVEFEIRKVSDRKGGSFNRALCKTCLATALADDTASIVKISRPANETEPPAGN